MQIFYMIRAANAMRNCIPPGVAQASGDWELICPIKSDNNYRYLKQMACQRFQDMFLTMFAVM